jgi:hypothetical protein
MELCGIFVFVQFHCFSVAGGFMRLAPEDGGQSEMRMEGAVEVAYGRALNSVSDASKMRSKIEEWGGIV